MDLQQFFEVYHYHFCSDVTQEIECRVYEKGEVIVQAGEEIDGLYFLVRGKYTVSSLEITGKELLLRHCQSPAIIGDIELFDDCIVQSNCVAAETCVFMFISRALYENRLKYDTDFT